MSTQKFLEDRERGHVGVQIVKERLEKQGAKVTVVPDGQFDDYDILVLHPKRKDPFAAEVKTDFRCAETGNVALESNALAHSKTDVWFYTLMFEKPEVHLISRQKAIQSLRLAPRSGLYGEHSEKVSLIPYQTFKSELSLGQLN